MNVNTGIQVAAAVGARHARLYGRMCGMIAACSRLVTTTACASGIAAAALVSGASADVTYSFTNQTWTGFSFTNLTAFFGPLTGTLTGVSVNATLNSSTAYTYADDLCLYVDFPPLSAGGLLQVGGFSNLSASQRLSWVNGGSSAPGTVVNDTKSFMPIVFTGSTSDPIVWLGNGYGASGTSGAWTGSITLHGLGLGHSDSDGDGWPDWQDNCPFTANPIQSDCDGDGIGDACALGDDFNANQVPDVCECIADILVDGVVDGSDLGALLSQWGPASAGAISDLNRDGQVNGADLGFMLNAWGPCPN
jgi:hypothetical protein